MDGGERPGQESLRLKHGAYIFYLVSFAAVLALTILGLAFGEVAEALVGLPMVFILGAAIFTDRKAVHVPPEMVVLVVAVFFLSAIGRTVSGGNGAVDFFADVLTGVNLGILGLILVYIMMKSMPGWRNEDRRVVAFVSICIAVASYSVIRLAQYCIYCVFPSDSVAISVDEMMVEMGAIFVGAMIVAGVYGLRRESSMFGGILNSFLEENSDLIGMDGSGRSEVLRLVEAGESEWLEFKSTLRTNLNTGENDKRMEKAVLKTIVAFLNSDGGDLLIGVSDDGTVVGADVQSFENKDKMGLHLSNVISAQIGPAALPYISTRMVDFDDRTVVHVKCQACPMPVFLKDGKQEIFYVRKGPQSDELTGTSLLAYVENRKRKKGKLGKRAPRPRRPGRRFGSRLLLVLLEEVEGLLRLGEGPGDEDAHDDREDRHYDRVDGHADEVVGGAEHGCDHRLDGLVPGQRGDEAERGGDQGREGLEHLNLESVAFLGHVHRKPRSEYIRIKPLGGNT